MAFIDFFIDFICFLVAEVAVRNETDTKCHTLALAHRYLGTGGSFPAAGDRALLT
ncbi:MAG TPA: hypothetical protein VNF47_02730 [Streptosporangiaceae bacterium]|nr:hypothetical protein [Streptosporangiaceae bacterium]